MSDLILRLELMKKMRDRKGEEGWAPDEGLAAGGGGGWGWSGVIRYPSLPLTFWKVALATGKCGVDEQLQ